MIATRGNSGSLEMAARVCGRGRPMDRTAPSPVTQGSAPMGALIDRIRSCEAAREIRNRTNLRRVRLVCPRWGR
jgi:hypothetical protein